MKEHYKDTLKVNYSIIILNFWVFLAHTIRKFAEKLKNRVEDAGS